MSAPRFLAQASFAGGEFSPALWGRIDISKYLTGLKTARNALVMPQGGVRNRPGTALVAAAGNSTEAVRLIPFVASTRQAYVIELGNYYARFYTQDAQVALSAAAAWATGTPYAVGNFVSSGGLIYYCLVAHTSGTFATDLASGKWVQQSVYQIPTPWAAADIFNLKFAQSADVMYFAHPSYAPQTMTFNNATSWVLAAYTFLSGPFMVQNTGQSNTITPSAATVTNTNVPITYISGGTWGSSSQVNPITVNVASVSNLSVGQAITVTGMNGTFATQLNGNQFYILLIKNLASGSYQITLSYTQGGPPVYPAPAVSAQEYVPTSANLSIAGTITLTSSANVFVSGHVGALFQLISTINAQTVTFTPTTSLVYSSSIQCGHDWSIITSGSWTGTLAIQASIDNGATWTTIQTLDAAAVNNNFTTSGDTGFGQCLIRISSGGGCVGCTAILTTDSFDWYGVVQVVSYTSPLSVQVNILPIGNTNTGLANTIATWQWSEGSWSTYRGWPSCVSFYQDRLCWASTPAEIETIWLSKTSSYNDFGISEPTQADDGFSIVLPSRSLNAVSTLIVMPQFMVALTSDSEWAISPGNDGILSSTSVNVQLQGHRGSSSIDPVVVGIELILMQQMGTVVRNLIFQLAVNGFFGDNISIVSQHLFTGYQIAQMSYQQEPDSIVWLVRNDGQLLSMTYMRDQEMMAWTHHDTAGTFESVCTIPNQALGINETWFVVNRNGTRYIERLMPRDQGTSPAQQFFVDCGIRTTFVSPSKAITGLPYPDGTALAVLADGCVVPGMVCNSGGFTLPVASTVVTVGLPYISDIETLRIESPDQRGATQGRKSLIPKVTVRLWNSRGGYFSCTLPSDSSTTNMDPFRQRSASDNFNAPIPLKTEDYTVVPRGQYTEDGHICIRQVDPLPFCLLGVFPSFVAGEK